MYIIIWNSKYLPQTAIYDPYKHSAGHDEPKFPPGTISAHDSCLRLYSYSDSPVIYSLQYCTAVRELRAEIKKQALKMSCELLSIDMICQCSILWSLSCVMFHLCHEIRWTKMLLKAGADYKWQNWIWSQFDKAHKNIAEFIENYIDCFFVKNNKVL